MILISVTAGKYKAHLYVVKMRFHNGNVYGRLIFFEEHDDLAYYKQTLLICKYDGVVKTQYSSQSGSQI